MYKVLELYVKSFKYSRILIKKFCSKIVLKYSTANKLTFQKLIGINVLTK